MSELDPTPEEYPSDIIPDAFVIEQGLPHKHTMTRAGKGRVSRCASCGYAVAELHGSERRVVLSFDRHDGLRGCPSVYLLPDGLSWPFTLKDIENRLEWIGDEDNYPSGFLEVVASVNAEGQIFQGDHRLPMP